MILVLATHQTLGVQCQRGHALLHHAVLAKLPVFRAAYFSVPGALSISNLVHIRKVSDRANSIGIGPMRRKLDGSMLPSA